MEIGLRSILPILFIFSPWFLPQQRVREPVKQQKRWSVSEIKFEQKFAAGLSGLSFSHFSSPENAFVFFSNTDRGPNGDKIETKDTQGKASARVFYEPDFQVKIYEIHYWPRTKTVKVVRQIPLWWPDGQKVLGLPPWDAQKYKFSEVEQALRENKEKIAAYPFGLDPEALYIAKDGTFWLAEEYGPSIFQVSSTGILLKMYRPKNSPSCKLPFCHSILPSALSRREINKGFEGLAGATDKLWVFLQSPLPHEARTKESIMVLEVDTQSNSVKRVLPYIPTGSRKGVQISDVGTLDLNKILVLETDGQKGLNAHKAIYLWELVKNRKTLVADFSGTSLLDIQKLEGMALVDPFHIALVQDNDFGAQRGASNTTTFAWLSLSEKLTKEAEN